MKKYPKILILLFVLIISQQIVCCSPKLCSYPSASATIYLDFDGYYVQSGVWNMGEPINCLPSTMTDAQITEVFNRVAEDYRPFNINITTDSVSFLSAPITNRIRIIVTPTSAWFPSVGGVAYIGSFVWGDDTPAFVFCALLGNSPKMVAESCTHESGHTLGLVHQSRYDTACNLTEIYNSGVGSGQTSWAPVMGYSYYRNMTGWHNGSTQFNCLEKQNDLSVITSQNGFSYRSDDYAESLTANTFSLNMYNINASGVITTTIDKDAFKIVLAQRNSLNLNIKPFGISATSDNGFNLDIKLQLYNAASQLIRTYDPADILNVSFDTILNAGTYFLLVDGTGNRNASEYGSLGSYTITGNIGTTVLPIHDVTLNGKVENGKHNLDWKIISDEAYKSATIETSTDGNYFIGIATFNSSVNTLKYTPSDQRICYYRLKVVAINGQIVYSNTLVLKAEISNHVNLSIQNLNRNELVINSKENCEYLISDFNGREIATGKVVTGTNRIGLKGWSTGLYSLFVLTNNSRQIFKIIK